MQKISFMSPAVTAFLPDGSLDEQGNHALYEHLISGGVDGIIVMGTTGEFFAMPLAQRKQLIQLACNAIQGRTRVIAGTGCMNADETIELSNYALACGADAVLVVPPFYFALSDASVEAYFDQLAREIHGDILLYNFPDRTGYDLKPQVVLRLVRRHANLVGYKDTVVDAAHTREMVKALHPEFPEFEILTGFDDNFVHNVLCGGNGTIGALSNLAPELTSGLCRAVKAGDAGQVVLLQRKIDQLMDLYAISVPFVTALKHAMVLRGIPIQAHCTAPLMPLTQEQERQLWELLERLELC